MFLNKQIFCLMGPTASGKTDLASLLVQQFPFEVISVDSAMIYREMNIGTAKPSASELKQTPHRMIDILDPHESFSAAAFCEAAIAHSEDILSRGKIPLLVGGTMMYFQALQQGLTELPSADESLRGLLLEQAEAIGWPAMHAQLAKVDPLTAARIHPHDTQRIQRALEVYQITGKALSLLLSEQKASSPYTFTNIALLPNDRLWLHQRINQRFEQMLAQGFIQEVKGLLKKWPLTQASPSLRCVGYRQAADYIAGNEDYDSFVDQAKAATRQLAKRQLTWLRHWSLVQKVVCDEPGVEGKILAIMHEILDNTRMASS